VAPSETAWAAWKERLAATAPKVEHWVEDHGQEQSLYVVDPSGNVLEIASRPSVAVVASPGAEATVDEWIATDERGRLAGRTE
jgi:hypothetical protein